MPSLSAALLGLAFVLCWAGFGLLALAQERHFCLFYPSFRPFTQLKRAQAAIGIIAIFLSLPLCIAAQAASFGSLLWLLLLPASAMTVALQLTWAPSALKPIAWLVKRCFHAVRHSQCKFERADKTALSNASRRTSSRAKVGS